MVVEADLLAPAIRVVALVGAGQGACLLLRGEALEAQLVGQAPLLALAVGVVQEPARQHGVDGTQLLDVESLARVLDEQVGHVDLLDVDGPHSDQPKRLRLEDAQRASARQAFVLHLGDAGHANVGRNQLAHAVQRVLELLLLLLLPRLHLRLPPKST